MNLLQLYQALNKAAEALEKQDTLLSATQVILHYEESAMKDGFSEATSEGISDIRLIDDWALPGDSLVNDEGPTPKKLVIFYDNHFNLDSSLDSSLDFH
jgi:hypothetical protein